jgi:hypothetical protein
MPHNGTAAGSRILGFKGTNDAWMVGDRENPTTLIEGAHTLSTTKLVAALIVISLIGVSTVSFARARGGSGRGYSGRSWSSSAPGSMGSRGSHSYDQNGAKPIEQSVTQRPSATAPQPAPGSPPPTAQPAPARQPSFLQRNSLLAGIAAGLAGSWIGHVEGSEETPIESGEVWTFMRHQIGKWLLSAIQQ